MIIMGAAVTIAIPLWLIALELRDLNRK